MCVGYGYNSLPNVVDAVNRMIAVKESIKCSGDIDIIKSMFKVNNELFDQSQTTTIVYIYFLRGLSGNEEEYLNFVNWLNSIAEENGI